MKNRSQKSDIQNNNIKEKDLAYGGQALIEGVLMRGQSGYAFTVKKNDGDYYKEKKEYVSLGKRIKLFGLPFVRGIAGLFENMILGMKILNKSAEIAYPEEENGKISSIAMFFLFFFSLLLAMSIFVGVPYFLTSLFSLSHNYNPFSYNLVSGLIRMIMFFGYLSLISLLKDTKRLFGYHGAEHKTIHAYEAKKELTVENVKEESRLHPRCGTSFVFIVFIITLFVFPFFNIFFNSQGWYTVLENYGRFGSIAQKLIHILSHILVGMPIVGSISYEILKLSGKFSKNPIIKVFIAPGLFFQLFTTRQPDDTMIKAGILSLKMILGEEKPDIKRNINDNISAKLNIATACFIFPILLLI